MAEQSMFFDSTDTVKRPVTGQLLAFMHSMMLGGGGTGIAQEEGYTPFVVSPKQNMTITLGQGAMFIQGYLYYNDSNLDLEVSAADPTRDRIDRVVIEFNNETTKREIKAKILKGIPSTSPVAPTLTRNSLVYELSVAYIRVKAGKSFIEASEITSEKNNPSVCGYIPLHNTLRGINVDENGLTSLPNQSYFEVVKENINLPIPDRTAIYLNLSDGLKKDHQSEIDTTNHTFIPKTSGVYLFFGYIRFPNWSAGAAPDIQLYMDVNGLAVTSLFARATNQSRDNIFQGTLFYYLNAGDVANFNVYIYDAPAGTQVLDYRIMSTKLS
jgi:hypothetical protein